MKKSIWFAIRIYFILLLWKWNNCAISSTLFSFTIGRISKANILAFNLRIEINYPYLKSYLYTRGVRNAGLWYRARRFLFNVRQASIFPAGARERANGSGTLVNRLWRAVCPVFATYTMNHLDTKRRNRPRTQPLRIYDLTKWLVGGGCRPVANGPKRCHSSEIPLSNDSGICFMPNES